MTQNRRIKKLLDVCMLFAILIVAISFITAVPANAATNAAPPNTITLAGPTTTTEGPPIAHLTTAMNTTSDDYIEQLGIRTAPQNAAATQQPTIATTNMNGIKRRDGDEGRMTTTPTCTVANEAIGTATGDEEGAVGKPIGTTNNNNNTTVIQQQATTYASAATLPHGVCSTNVAQK